MKEPALVTEADFRRRYSRLLEKRRRMIIINLTITEKIDTKGLKEITEELANLRLEAAAKVGIDLGDMEP